jgi:excisionase family DNA binding protein
MTDHLLNAKQAGELLNVPATWVLAEARRDRIPHIRFGRYVRFDRETLLDWAYARQRGPVGRRRPSARLAHDWLTQDAEAARNADSGDPAESAD